MPSAKDALFWVICAILDLFIGFSMCIPVLLVLDFILTSWMIYHFCVSYLILPAIWKDDLVLTPSPDLFRAGVAILVVYSVLLFFAAGSCVFLWFQSIRLKWHGGYRNPPGAIETAKPVMQWDPDAGVTTSGLATLAHDGKRPNRCKQCGMNTRAIMDRVYHEPPADGCPDRGHFPLLDHYCTWLWAPVCLTTIKAYLLLMVYIAVYHAFGVVVGAWALSRREFRGMVYPYAVLLVFFPLLVLWLRLTPMVGKWRWLAFQNITLCEYRRYVRDRLVEEWPMVVYTRDGAGRRCFEEFIVDDNPWDLGSTFENVRAALGDHVWQWPLFWVQPRRVQDYCVNEGFDLPFDPLFIEQIQREFTTEIDVIGPTPPAPAAHPVRRRQLRTSEL